MNRNMNENKIEKQRIEEEFFDIEKNKSVKSSMGLFSTKIAFSYFYPVFSSHSTSPQLQLWSSVLNDKAQSE